jgi:ribosomal protein S18 acetylase RimI-like enzyme
LITVRPLDPGEAAERRTDLVRLLQDAVESGASVGFLLPLKRPEIEAYWQSVVAAMRDGERHLLAAFDDDQLIGAVQLGLESRPNGRHRAEIMKLMVQRTHRRRGVGRLLMAGVIELAVQARRTLLLLDVRTGDAAEALYRSLGFVQFGEVPHYARNPDDGLAASSFYYLELSTAS